MTGEKGCIAKPRQAEAHGRDPQTGRLTPSLDNIQEREMERPTAPSPSYVAALKCHHNKHGYRGIWYDAKKQYFAAKVAKGGKKLGKQGFRTAKEAALGYDDLARIVYGDDACLNFPGPGEKKTIRGSRCTHGDASLYYHAERKFCRICNREAVTRYRARKKAQAEPQGAAQGADR